MTQRQGTGRLHRLTQHPIVVDSGYQVGTTVLMAGAGALFWVIAARLHPAEVVGVAGALVSAGTVLAIIAQIGINQTLVRVLPTSTRQAADLFTGLAVTGVVGALLGLLYALVAPAFAEDLVGVVDSPARTLALALLVGATAANITTDAVFLSLRRLGINMQINGVIMGVAKCALPFALVGWGAFGLFAATGLAALIALVSSVAVLVRLVGLPRSSASPELRSSLGFAGASYVATVLDRLPMMVLPLLVINSLGAAAGGVFFICLQIAALLNSMVFAIGSSSFAEGSRHPERLTTVRSHSARALGVAVGSAAVVVLLLAPLLLRIMGKVYVADGTDVLRVLALGALALAAYHWSEIQLRLAGRLRAMVLMPLATTTLMLVLAWALTPLGIVWTATAWALSLVVGALVGITITRTRTRRTPRAAARVEQEAAP